MSIVFIASPSSINWYQSFGKRLMMAGDDDEQFSLSTMLGNIEGRICAINSTLDGVVQVIKRLSLKLDDWGVADGKYWSGRERSSNTFPPLPPPSHPPQRPPPYYPSTNLSLPTPPHIHHRNHHHINHRLIFLNHHYYTPLHASTILQLVLFRDCSATKRPLILSRNIKSSIQGVRSRTRYANLILDNGSCKNIISRALVVSWS